MIHLILKAVGIASVLATLSMSAAFAGQCSNGNVAIQKAVDSLIAGNIGVKITHLAQRAEEEDGMSGTKFEVLVGTEIPNLPQSGIRLVRFLIDKESCEVTYENALSLDPYNGTQPKQ